MMEDLITDLRNMTGMGRFARAEVREILAYLESVGWLSEPKAAEPVIEPPAPPIPQTTTEIDPPHVPSDAAFDAMSAAAEFNPHV